MKLPWKYIVVALGIGLFTGSAATLLMLRAFPDLWMRRGPEALMQRFSKELQLTEGQRRGIKAILWKDREKMEAFRQTVRLGTRASIRALLTPEQQSHFDRLEAQTDVERQKRNERLERFFHS